MFVWAQSQPLGGGQRPVPESIPSGAAQVEGSLLLRDGGSVHVRAIRADDDERLTRFHRKLSPASIIFRFFHYFPELPAADAQRFTHVDYESRMALVATTGEGDAEEILAWSATTTTCKNRGSGFCNGIIGRDMASPRLCFIA